jgi:hypothetical protein
MPMHFTHKYPIETIFINVNEDIRIFYVSTEATKRSLKDGGDDDI